MHIVYQSVTALNTLTNIDFINKYYLNTACILHVQTTDLSAAYFGSGGPSDSTFMLSLQKLLLLLLLINEQTQLVFEGHHNMA